MLLLFTLLNFLASEQHIDDGMIFELPPNDISIIEIVDYFDD